MSAGIRPVPGDPSEALTAAMLDIRDAEWLLIRAGDYECCVVETMLADGSGWTRRIALTLPVRPNHGTEERTLQILLDPENCMGLIENLLHSVKWAAAAERLGK